MINIWWMWHLCNCDTSDKKVLDMFDNQMPICARSGPAVRHSTPGEACHKVLRSRSIDISGSAIEVLLRILMDFECDFAFGSSKGVASPNLRSAPCDWPLCQHLRFGPGVLGQNQSRKLQVVHGTAVARVWRSEEGAEPDGRGGSPMKSFPGAIRRRSLCSRRGRQWTGSTSPLYRTTK